VNRGTLKRVGLLACLAAGLLLAAPLSAQELSAGGQRVDLAVRSAIERSGQAVALITFRTGTRLEDGAAHRQAIAEVGETLEARLPASSLVRARRLRWVPCLIAGLAGIDALAVLESSPEVLRVELDEPGRGALFESAEYLRAPLAHELGFRGEGTIAAVLDSGIDRDHPAFAGAVVHFYRFLDQGADVGPEPELVEDGLGHGTNVAGIIASRGGRTLAGDAVPPGIAPDAQLVVVKVLKDDDSGWLSDWALGVDHVLGLKVEGAIDIDVINMSLVSNRTYEGVCDDRVSAFAAACQAAVDGGLAIFGASGNEGALGSLAVPACYSSVVAVGSVVDTEPDRISTFTNRSEHLDLLAPGQSISAPGRNGGIGALSGTSQATPHAAAAALLLEQARPELSAAETVEILLGTGRPFTDPGSGLVFPILDARSAVEAALAPRVKGLRCMSLSASIVADWEAAAGADRYELEVLRDGEPFLQATIPGGETRFVIEIPGDYTFDLGIAAVSAEGFRGLAARCSVRVSTPPLFQRGDCDGDDLTNLSDAVRLLNALFLGSDDPPCHEACNANDDGELNIADAIYLLGFLFRGGAPPPEPSSGCGIDTTQPFLACRTPGC
jgi:hypothetical protein